MYDWANSVYNLVITSTFFPIYFEGVTKSAFGENSVPLLGRTFKNTALYNYTLSVAYLAIALLLPILSSIADSRGNKKKFMQFFCYMGATACMGLFWFRGPNLEWGLTCCMLAAIGFVGSLVFYNSYLPEIASHENRDRVSAKGFAMGYIGSVIMQALGFVLVLYFSAKGDQLSGPRFTFLLVGLWWISFAQVSFLGLPSGARKAKPANFLTAGFRELRKVWMQLKQMSVLRWFLGSYFFYNMGVQTVMLVATLFGRVMLGLPADRLIITIIIIQLVAIGGAHAMARLSGTFGNVNVLMAIVIFWILICLSAYYVAALREKGVWVEYHFYGLAAAVGFIMGGIQSLSRSTYSKLMPATEDTASFFSFYDVTEKVAIVLGVFTFGFLDENFGMKTSVLGIVVFFALGLGGLAVTRSRLPAAKGS
jgi:UMF1 family MFS transporter